MVVALGGFWLLRGVVKERAEDVSTEIAADIAEKTAKKAAEKTLTDRGFLEPMITRIVRDELELRRDIAAIDEDELAKMMAALNGKDAKNGK